ncbi:DUF6777 domain-containing protein [Streptomyces sp. NPDC058274]|uniref:DUF6777 domain-containing protein n=1 Tax=Streptomyces sp. NPDC058274 TaxID=3346416 RepID=UPI0036EADAC4
MSVEPPSSGRPTGPPSGPLSGPSQPGPSEPSPTQPTARPPMGPPAGGSGAGDTGGSGGGGGSGGAGGPSGPQGTGGAGRGGPDRAWWKSAPRVALIATGVVAAVVLALVFTRSDGTSDKAGGEVFLQSAAKTGPDPFTESTATDSSTVPETPAASDSAAESANVTRGVDGSAPGLYGGTRNVTSCDVEKQISALRAAPAKNKAFASVAGVQPSGVPAYLRSLTPVQLRMDTRVTNHGYRDGAATSYQAVLQAGTAVLVDDHGVPRVRCACGNPLTPPVAQQNTPKRTGDSWSSYRPQNVVVVTPATTVINVFVMFDPDHDDWFRRHKGDTGEKDQKTKPPVDRPSPSVSGLTPSPGSSSPCVSSPGGTPPIPCDSSSSPSSSTPSAPSSSQSSESSEPPSSASSGTSSSASTSSAPASASSFSAPQSSGTTPAL